MDAAYDAQEIAEHIRSQGRVPLIAPKPKVGRSSKNVIVRNYPRQFSEAERQRYRERAMVERVYRRLKDEFGGVLQDVPNFFHQSFPLKSATSLPPQPRPATPAP